MRIYRMTATFGKLEHETLTLEPGLNVIEAPNEWGKSTWCAFLITMLYGLDTRAKSTKTALADKEKYAPWTGSPMAGRIDLNWNGRDITIERSTAGRTPMGVFRAYETASGLAVPELTAATCGRQLLGVEESVYRRTGFIRQADLPVTRDDALRRRLNALVTTGDETGDSDRLTEELKNLKNKCRYNRTGLLPQAEAQRRTIEEKLLELESLQAHARTLKERLGEVKSWMRALENHDRALQYASAEAEAQRLAQVRDQRDRAEIEMTALEQRCAGQPARETVAEKIRTIQAYWEAVEACQAEEALAVSQPLPPLPPEPFRGMTAEQAAVMVERDSADYERFVEKTSWRVFYAAAWVFLLLMILLGLLQKYPLALGSLLVSLTLLILGLQKWRKQHHSAGKLEEKYGSRQPDTWKQLLRQYQKETQRFEQAMLDYQSAKGDLDIQATFLQRQREALFGSQSPERVLEIWLKMQKQWDAYDAACREYQQAQKHLEILQDISRIAAEKPLMEDILVYSPEETGSLLEEARAEQQRLQNRLGQYQGKMEALGDAASLHRQLQLLDERIGKLEEIYSAAVLALDTLAKAQQELQRKFAPKISGRAGELLAQMTAGRYDRLILREDLSMLAGADQEQVLRDILWRSDGTVDQLYLALRLAVAEELMPDAPLILDDVFVRFDDTRLEAAVEILKQEAVHRQVVLFTCQHREKKILQ